MKEKEPVYVLCENCLCWWKPEKVCRREPYEVRKEPDEFCIQGFMDKNGVQCNFRIKKGGKK